jgi:serine/threonine protein kinase/tetratricopeptide (TPR) repeat protein
MSAERAREIFFELVAQVPPEQWDTRAAELAGPDEPLRQRVLQLLAAHRGADSFLESPAVGPGETRSEPAPVAAAGTVIDGYKLLQPIGEGGMGVVWMADQLHPVQRRVALKIIKPGMDSKQVLARFEAERQALALMDHPNIARVFDAGSTPEGRPYFVMELVKGRSITAYCDEQRLTPRQRLELFLPVCRAIQHAHQKGVIHRDIKPSNVLVAPFDGKPVVKVIDFGVAKATGQRLTDATLFTDFGSVVGTLEYMSPEQAELNNQDIDTRSDIYSLGVLLYQLLTGSTPLDRGRLKAAAFTEMLRLIREEEPPRPSTRLSESAESLPAISAQRQTAPAKLAKLVRGELDWIVMKALDKDRGRRYETANGFAMDVQRYLSDEPVQACPPSGAYRLRKFVRRNKGPVVTGVTIAGLLVTGVGVSTWLAVTARRSERWAVESRDKEKAARLAETEQRRRARKTVDDMYSQFAEKWLAEQPRLEKVQREIIEKALGYYEDFALADSSDPQEQLEAGYAYFRVGEIRGKLGDQAGAEKAYGRAIEVFEGLAAAPGAGALHRYALLRSHNRLAGILYVRNRLQAAETAYRQGADVGQAMVADFPDNPDHWLELAGSYHGLGMVAARFDRVDDAERCYLRALDVIRKQMELLPSRPDIVRMLAGVYRSLGNVQNTTKRFRDAEQSHRQAIAQLEKLVKDFPRAHGYREDLTMSRNNLAIVLRNAGRLPEAIQAQGQAVELQAELAKEFPNFTQYQRTLAASYMNRGVMLKANRQVDAAADDYRKAAGVMAALAARVDSVPEYRHLLALCHHNIGNLLRETGRMAEAETAYGEALSLLKALVDGNRDVRQYRLNLSDTYTVLSLVLDASGRTAEAQKACRAALAADPTDAKVKDMLAWSLATCPDPALRNADEAVALATEVVEHAKQNGHYWATLGVARYRAGNWKESLAALTAAAQLHPGPNSADVTFFIAMAHWKLGHMEEALKAFDQAVAWKEKYGQKSGELKRFYAEAAALLSGKGQDPPKETDSTRPATGPGE